MNEPQWVNYHKHSSLSNVYTTDSPITVNDYLIELKNRYGSEPCVYSCVEHGWAGNYFKIYDDIEKFNKKNNTNIKFVFGIEAYWVKDRLTKDSSNCHIVILARNDNGRKQINKMLSVANKTGYYYKPRIDLALIEEYLRPNDVMITTACIAFWNKYDDINDIVINLFNKFPYFYLEVQSHHTDKQKECNRHILELSKLYNIPIIAGCDSHVITEAQLADRDDLLASKKIHYEDEDGWFMDYPNYDTLFQRFQKQNILADNEIKSAIERTNVIFNFEDIVLDRSLKVPVLIPYRNKTQEERNKIFENILAAEWKEQRNDINESKLEQYQSEIKHDINEIESCGMADYFILSYNVMKLGQSKYGGILTPSGRGSAVSMYLNKLLRLTKVDKVNSPVLMYSERFLTKERVLASKTPPDIDSNVSDREPFIQAQRELVGELGTYDLLALGTLKIKAAWKMYARAHGVDPQTANEVSEQIGLYEKAKKHADDNEIVNIHDYIDKKYYDLIDNCQSYLGIYDTRKGHPCGCLCYDGDAEADIGVILCKSESTGKEVLTAVIESGTIDAFGYLKQDYLIVDSIGLTYDIYKEIGIEPYSVNQLLKIIDGNKKVWDIYSDGYTMCVNQVEQTGAIEKVKRYKPQNIYELTQFIAGIRPSFQSMYHTFEKREHFEYGIKALDSLLQDEYCSSSFIIMQEQLMKVLGFAGFPMSETYTIIKAISKKKDYVIKGAKEKFIPNFTQAILNTKETNDNQKAKEMAEQVWRIIEDSASYGFNCVSKDTKLYRAKNSGSFIPTIEEMYKIKNDIQYAKKTGHKSLHDKYVREGYGKALSLCDDKKIRENKIIDIYYNGYQKIYEVKTESGKIIKCTMNHKFPTPNGVLTLSNLSVGDNLYCLGDYKHKYFDSSLTNGDFENNYPSRGQCGFQKNENGASVIYDNERKLHIEHKDCCEICGKIYTSSERFELHHKDFNRKNNQSNNFCWCCVSCHKKLHYQNGRTRRYEKGIDNCLEKIISIEYIGEEDVYDVEMAHPNHTFVIDNGIVTHNCSHSYCMAIDSVTIAYLKAYYPLEFYKVVLQRFTDKGEKDKITRIKQEMMQRGFELKPIKFRDDNRQFSIDKEHNYIIQTMASIKDMPKNAPNALYQLGKQNITKRSELYQSLISTKEINKTAIDILFKLDYFSEFAKPNTLLYEFPIFEKYYNAKVLSKDNLSEIEYQAAQQCAKKETDKQFRDFEPMEFIKLVLSQSKPPKTTLYDKMRYQMELLGYCNLTDPNAAGDIFLVDNIEQTSYNTYITLYRLYDAWQQKYKVNKRFYAKNPLQSGDIIQVIFEEKPKWKKVDDGFVKTGETEIIVKGYRKMGE